MVRRCLACALMTAHLMGCLSVQTTGFRKSTGEGGGIAVEVYEDDRAHRDARVGPAGILSELERQDGKDWVPVFRSLNPSWAVAGLPPGRYRLRFPARLDDAGNVVRLNGGAQAVAVSDGSITEVHAVLEHVSPVLVAVGVVTVVVAAVLISRYLSEHDLPTPPLPPQDLLEATFYVTLDLALSPRWLAVSDRAAPVVTSHFPAQGAVVAVRRPKVVLALSEPINPETVDVGGVTVLGERSGLIGGGLSYDDGYWWLVWEPRTDLLPGDTFHVTLARDAVEDLAGNEPGVPFTFTFTTPR